MSSRGSRTGTARWRKIRDQRLQAGIDQGIFNCPECGVGLDYEYTRRPNSAEPDHIAPWVHSRDDSFENTRIICRRCNQSLGGRQNKGRRRKPKPFIPKPLKSSRKS